MAGFRQHVMFSTAIGAGYAFALNQFGFDPGSAVIAGGLCGLAGMLPDLDSDTGTPIKEMFGLIGTVAALILFHRLRRFEVTAADRIVAAALCYLAVRFGVRMIFEKFTVHRGMWHSLPAGFLAAQLAFLATDDALGQASALAIAGGVFFGFLSHLVLDEFYSVQFKGLLPSLKRSHGTALKFVSESKFATIAVWLLLAAVTFQSAMQMGLSIEFFPSSQAEQAPQANVVRVVDSR